MQPLLRHLVRRIQLQNSIARLSLGSLFVLSLYARASCASLCEWRSTSTRCASYLQCMDEDMCDVIQPEKQLVTQSYANNGLNFDRQADANCHISVPPFTAAGLPAKL